MKLSITNPSNSPVEVRDSKGKSILVPAAGLNAPPVTGDFSGEGLEHVRFMQSLGALVVSDEKPAPAPVVVDDESDDAPRKGKKAKK